MANGFNIGRGMSQIGAGGSFMQGLGQGVSSGMPGLTKTMAEAKKSSRLSDREKLERAANPRDVPEIEALFENWQFMTEDRRQKELSNLKKTLDTRSLGLLNWYEQRGGEAPPLTMETWPGAKEGKSSLIQSIMGTTPEHKHELELGQLPAGERGAAARTRFGRQEAAYPGITEVGMQRVPTGVTGRELSPIEIARERAREGGRAGAVAGVTGKFTAGMFPWEKKEIVDEHMAKGILDEIGYAAAVTYVNDTDVPTWLSAIDESLWPALGVKKNPDGSIENAIPDDNEKEAVRMVNLRAVFATEIPLAGMQQRFSGMWRQIRIAAWGKSMLSQAEQSAIEKEASSLPLELIAWAENPAMSMNPSDSDFLDRVYDLVRFFGVEGAAAILTLAMDPNARAAYQTGVGGAG